MVPLLLLLAATLPNRVVPGGLGVQSGDCFANLHDGDRFVRGEHYKSRFVFDGDYAFEVWYLGDGAGEGAYKRYGSQWCVITRGGGVITETLLVQERVPRVVAHRLFELLERKEGDHR